MGKGSRSAKKSKTVPHNSKKKASFTRVAMPAGGDTVKRWKKQKNGGVRDEIIKGGKKPHHHHETPTSETKKKKVQGGPPST